MDESAMASWNHAEHVLNARIVYYGPTFGGKTTTLEALHRIVDPEGHHELVSIRTADDRTLFFDLLPFDLGEVLGYRLALRLYTVPGQVRYETTRRVVLSGADAIVFVADSSHARREQNLWSLQNLRMNMKATGLDPKLTPIVYQLNKRDLPDAAAEEQVAGWLGVDVGSTHGTVATTGCGVIEPLLGATRGLVEKIAAAADPPARSFAPVELAREIERVIAPLAARAKAAPVTTPSRRHAIVLGDENLLASAVQTSVALCERMAAHGGIVRSSRGR
jgi:hypothetical protein